MTHNLRFKCLSLELQNKTQCLDTTGILNESNSLGGIYYYSYNNMADQIIADIGQDEKKLEPSVLLVGL